MFHTGLAPCRSVLVVSRLIDLTLLVFGFCGEKVGQSSPVDMRMKSIKRPFSPCSFVPLKRAVQERKEKVNKYEQRFLGEALLTQTDTKKNKRRVALEELLALGKNLTDPAFIAQAAQSVADKLGLDPVPECLSD